MKRGHLVQLNNTVDPQGTPSKDLEWTLARVSCGPPLKPKDYRALLT
jgi:hypothetical protein